MVSGGLVLRLVGLSNVETENSIILGENSCLESERLSLGRRCGLDSLVVSLESQVGVVVFGLGVDGDLIDGSNNS